MKIRHRVEVVEHVMDATVEQWRSRDGLVVLRRPVDAIHWEAVLDGFRVHDAELLNDAEGLAPVTVEHCPLVAPTARELAASLAMQERLHLVFDAPCPAAHEPPT